MENKNNKASLLACFALASAWFGTHCGCGFATGAQGTSFWVKYGAHAIYLPVISAVIMAAAAGLMWELCRLTGARNYRQFSDALYAPYQKVFGTIHEILFISIMVMGISAELAGAGALLNSMLGLPYLLCVTIFAVVIIVLTMFGAGTILKFATVLSNALVLVITVCAVVGLCSQTGHLGRVVSGWETEYSALPAIWSAVVYASFQCVILGATVHLSGGLKSAKESELAAVLGFFMNCAMMLLMTYMLLSFYPETTGETLPLLAALEQMGIPWLVKAYSCMLLLAFITPAISCTGSLTSRFEVFARGTIKNEKARRVVITLVIILICFGIAQFGLLNIIKKGYNAIGYLGIPFVILPVLFIAPRKIRAARAAQKAEAE